MAKRLRFSTDDDLNTLHTVLRENPFQCATKWKQIQKSIVEKTKKEFSHRAIKEHVEHLIKLYLKGDKANLKKSGTEEQYQEKQQLLQQLCDLRREFVSTSQPETRRKALKSADNKASTSSNIKEEIPSADEADVMNAFEMVEVLANYEQDDSQYSNVSSLSTATTSNPLTTHTRKRKPSEFVSNDMLSYVKERIASKNAIKRKQLELEERKLSVEERKIALEEQKFALEKEERQKRLEVELQERIAHINNTTEQHKIVKILLEKLASTST